MDRIPFKELKKRLEPFRNMDNAVQISNEAKATNIGLMISTHIDILEANPGNRVFMPYYDRLLAVLRILEGGLL